MFLKKGNLRKTVCNFWNHTFKSILQLETHGCPFAFYDVNVHSRPSSSSRSNMICRWYSCIPDQSLISDIARLYIMPLLQECQESPYSYFPYLTT